MTNNEAANVLTNLSYFIKTDYIDIKDFNAEMLKEAVNIAIQSLADSQQSVHDKYAAAFADYCRAFADKHDLSLDDEDICVDGPIIMGDYFVGFEEIMYDVDNNIEVGVWETWYDTMLDLHTIGALTCNFRTWCKGFRPYTEDQIAEMKKLQSKIELQHQQLQNMIKTKCNKL